MFFVGFLGPLTIGNMPGSLADDARAPDISRSSRGALCARSQRLHLDSGIEVCERRRGLHNPFWAGRGLVEFTRLTRAAG